MQAGSSDTEIYSEVLRAQTKSFYVDLKENPRGRYVKVAEKGKYRPKSSIVLPASGVVKFLALLRHYLAAADSGQPTTQQDLIVESKVFSFSAGSNDRGQFLKIFESGGGFPRGGSSLMIPCGWNCAYLRQFTECMEKIARQVSNDLTELDVIQASPAGMNILPVASPTSPDVIQLDTKESGPVLSVGNKHFFFEMRSNDRGPYLKIKEVSGNMKNLVVLPLTAVSKFQEAISIAALQQLQEDGVGTHI